jgi:hypothetical protein
MIKIISCCDDDFLEMSKISLSSINEYCSIHNLQFVKYSVPKSYNLPAHWYKLDCLLNEINDEKNENIDYFLWIDSDAVILNNNFNINSIIDKNKFLHISKGFDTMNTGVMLFKKCSMSIDFISEAMLRTHYRNHPWQENMAMIEILFNEPNNFLPHVEFVKQNIFNAYDYDLYPEYQERQKNTGQYNKDSFIVHFPGMSKEKKLANMKRVKGIV